MGCGGLREPLLPLFSEMFLKNSQENKKYLYSWQVSRSPLSEFSALGPSILNYKLVIRLSIFWL